MFYEHLTRHKSWWKSHTHKRSIHKKGQAGWKKLFCLELTNGEFIFSPLFRCIPKVVLIEWGFCLPYCCYDWRLFSQFLAPPYTHFYATVSLLASFIGPPFFLPFVSFCSLSILFSLCLHSPTHIIIPIAGFLMSSTNEEKFRLFSIAKANRNAMK